MANSHRAWVLAVPLALLMGCSQPIAGSDGSVGCATDLTCPLGSFCGTAGRCNFECATDSDCRLTHEPSSTCDTRGRCSGASLADVGTGRDASTFDASGLDAAAMVDAPSCGGGPGCAGELTCCSGACVDVMTARGDCGFCGRSCDSGISDACTGGMCTCGGGPMCLIACTPGVGCSPS